MKKVFELTACPKETSVEVIEVPILVPIMIGIAYLTGMISLATMLTIIDVEVDDDWIITVDNKPIIKPANGLVKTTELLNACDA